MWLWNTVWFVALAFLMPALTHYGESPTIDHVADQLLLALLFFSMPPGACSGLFVSVMSTTDTACGRPGERRGLCDDLSLVVFYRLPPVVSPISLDSQRWRPTARRAAKDQPQLIVQWAELERQALERGE